MSCAWEKCSTWLKGRFETPARCSPSAWGLPSKRPARLCPQRWRNGSREKCNGRLDHERGSPFFYRGGIGSDGDIIAFSTARARPWYRHCSMRWQSRMYQPRLTQCLGISDLRRSCRWMQRKLLEGTAWVSLDAMESCERERSRPRTNNRQSSAVSYTPVGLR